MSKRELLKESVLEAIELNGGEASVTDVAKTIWQVHEADLRKAGDLFFSWQYDMRWAAQVMRDEGRLVLSDRNWAIPQ